jgi:tetratricopeptide (TPR) repeat protein
MNLSALKYFSILLLFTVLGFGVYSNTLDVPFYFDDINNIVENPHIRITKVSVDQLKNAGLKGYASSRPIGNISFALNYYFHKHELKGYHIVNLSIHIITAVFLYFFINITLNNPLLLPKYNHREAIALIAAIIWLVHPLHTQSVTYIVQRFNSMAAMFYMLSFLLYVKGRLASEKDKRWLLYSSSALAGIMALGSKENAALLLFFIFLYEWYFFQDLDQDWFKRHLKYIFGIIILFSLIALIYMGKSPIAKLKSINDYAHNEFTLTERVLTQFRVLIHYLSLLVYPNPSRLNVDYDFQLSHSLTDPITTLLALAAIAGLVGLAFITAKRERLLSFCILWFLGNLAIESSVIPLAIIFEHRTYLPSMLVWLLVVSLGYRYIEFKQVGIALACVVITVFSLWTYQRNNVWKDPVVFWEDCVEKSPQKARPRYNLGLALANQGKIEEAISHYSEALRIKPNYVAAHNNLGQALADLGRLKGAVKHFSEALRINPNNHKAHNNMGNALTSLGKQDEALEHFYIAIQIAPDSPEAHNNLANAMVHLNRFDEAIEHYTVALRINPVYSSAHNNIGNLLAQLGRLDEAINHYSEALLIDPDSAEFHNNLGVALAETGRAEEAMHNYLEALRLDSAYAEAHVNLGVELVNQGKIDEAIDHFRRALSLQPEFAEAMYHLAKLYHTRADYEKAMHLYQKMLTFLPDSPVVHYNIACIYSRQNRSKESIAFLQKAVAKGFDDWELLKTDSDLDNIRGSIDYKEFVKGR